MSKGGDAYTKASWLPIIICMYSQIDNKPVVLCKYVI